MEVFHSKEFVHRDMKPENILIGQTGKKAQTIFLIDFGLSKRYKNPANGKHNVNKKTGVCGTMKFISAACHDGSEHSRRDDMESLGLILISFLRGGSLPWSPIPKPEQLPGPNDPKKA